MLLLCLHHCLNLFLYMLNFSLFHGTFLSSCKHSIILPISKTNNPSFLSSFRPILLSPFLSKLLEYICFSQLNAFVSNFNILPSCQYGFRRFYSTMTELLHISDVVLHNFDNCRLTSIVALDFTKAFDTINHDLLLVKLKLYDLSHLALSLICLFLTNRTQQVLVYNSFLLFSS